MARRPKPWFRPSRGVWFVTLDGHQHNLGPGSEEEAEERFVELKKRLRKQEPVDGTIAVAVMDQFLEWCEKHRARPTYQWYLERIQPFAKYIGTMPLADLKTHHLQAYLNAHGWSPGHERTVIVAIQRAFRWAYKLEHIDRLPLRGIEKPPAGKREQIISETEFRKLLGLVNDQQFQDLLTVSWEIGCRPQESLRVESRHVDLVKKRWVFPTKESKGKKRIRIVYLTDAALEITKRQMIKHPTGPIFRNADGRPWRPYAVNSRFCKIQTIMGRMAMRDHGIVIPTEEIEKLAARLPKTKRINGVGVQKSERGLLSDAKQRLTVKEARNHAPKYCLYTFRHSWMTRLLAAGVDPITISTLAGHVDTGMLSRVYAHLNQNADHLQSALRRA
jgi:integrase